MHTFTVWNLLQKALTANTKDYHKTEKKLELIRQIWGDIQYTNLLSFKIITEADSLKPDSRPSRADIYICHCHKDYHSNSTRVAICMK